MKVNWQKHPDVANKSMDEIEEQIFMTSIDHGALVVRGSWFVADSSAEQTDMFFRATFAAAPGEQIAEAIRRFGEAVKEVFELENTPKRLE
jgi:aromatic amino acid aminotransferase I